MKKQLIDEAAQEYAKQNNGDMEHTANAFVAGVEYSEEQATDKGALNKLGASINDDNVRRGYWDRGVELHKKLLLITSEVVEFMEADRKGKHCRHVNIYNINDYENDKEFFDYYEAHIKGSQEEEAADVLIRALDLFAGLQIDMDAHVAAKRRYSEIKGVDPKKQY